MERTVTVFLDFANVDASLHSLGCRLTPGDLLHYLADEAEGRTLKTAFAYLPIDPRREHAQDAMIAELWQAGFIVKTKVGTIAGESYKCNLDVEMAMDIAKVAYESKPDIVVLVSGDSDFLPVVLELRGKGIRVETAAFSHALSEKLRRCSSGSILLDVLLPEEHQADCSEDYPAEEPAEDMPDEETYGDVPTGNDSADAEFESAPLNDAVRM